MVRITIRLVTSYFFVGFSWRAGSMRQAMRLSEELLREYAESGSEEAFREMVNRHLPLVYGAARRIGRNAHLAEDIAQQVFRDFAMKGATLPHGTNVAGWLYRHACYTASKAVRSEVRRTAREAAALAMDGQKDCAPAAIEPELEPALNQLAEEDRNAILLRYAEARDWREVGATLGISMEAAQKRGTRALEKLRAILGERGIQASAAVLGGTLAAGSQAVPGHLAGQICARAPGGIASQTAPQLLSSMKSKIAAAAVAGIAVTTPYLFQKQKLASISAENAELREEMAKARAGLSAGATREGEVAELERLRRENAELHKLRGDYTALRRQFEEFQKTNSARVAAASTTVEAEVIPKQVVVESEFASISSELLEEVRALGIPVPPPRGVEILSREQAAAFHKFVRERSGVNLMAAPRVTTLYGRQARVSIQNTPQAEGASASFGHVDVLPMLSPDGAVTALKVEVMISEPVGNDEVNGQSVPKFRVRKAESESLLGHGQALLLQGDSGPGDGDPLLVLINSTAINADGTAFKFPGRD